MTVDIYRGRLLSANKRNVSLPGLAETVASLKRFDGESVLVHGVILKDYRKTIIAFTDTALTLLIGVVIGRVSEDYLKNVE